MKNKISLTVIMITLNEEFHIKEAIENVDDIAEQIFIVDSLSTDKTVDLALANGAQVIQRPFTNFGDQWNFALNNLPVKTDWVLKLDPDERLTDELKSNIRDIINAENVKDGYEFARRLWFMGRPLSIYADVLRLWKTGKCKFTDVAVNEHPLIDGEVGYIEGIMEHHDSRDLHHWVNKQNLYTSMEANRKFSKEGLAVAPKLFGNKLERRMYIKKIFFKLPFRYTLQLLHELFIRGAIKSGRAGIKWAKLRVVSRQLVEYKTLETKELNRLMFVDNDNIKKEYHPEIISSELQKTIFKTHR